MDEPSLILGRALAAWGNAPDWSPCVNNAHSCERAEQAYADFLATVCDSWGLAIVRLGVLEEIEKDHGE